MKLNQQLKKHRKLKNKDNMSKENQKDGKNMKRKKEENNSIKVLPQCKVKDQGNNKSQDLILGVDLKNKGIKTK